jgi:hypothetical protein
MWLNIENGGVHKKTDKEEGDMDLRLKRRVERLKQELKVSRMRR